MRITLPWPPKQLTPNAKRRTHWRAYQPVIKSYRRTCGDLTVAAGLRHGGGLRITAITFNPPDHRRRDDDGMIAAFKAGRDGVADALGTDDHLFRPTYAFGAVVKGGAVVVEVDAPALAAAGVPAARSTVSAEPLCRGRRMTAHPDAWPDERILSMLDLLDHEGRSRAQVADILGTTKGAVLGMERRVRRDDARHPETVGDGTMPRGWWRR